MEKIEPQCYFFDKKNASYYRNEFLNNCKSRRNYTDRLHNVINTLKNSIEQICLLEYKKDPDFTYSEILGEIIKNIDTLENNLNCYRTVVEEETTAIQSKNFQEIMDNNVLKIKSSESNKGGQEICNVEDKE